MKIEKLFENRNSQIAGVLVLLVVVSLAGYVLSSYDTSDPARSEANESYATPGEDSVIDSDKNDEDVDTVVTIGPSVSPSRPVVDIGEIIEFKNQNDFPVRIEFEGSENRVIDAGDRIQIGFRSVEYYEVYNNENDEKIAGGGVGLDI